MQKSEKLKWFWKVNYLLTFYKLALLSTLIMPIIGIKTKIDWFEVLNFGSITFLIGYFGEWVQLPLGLLIVICYKSERTVLHFLYLLLLLILALVTTILYGMFLGSLGDM